MTTLSIIILSYNTKNLIKKCIESIYKYYEKELKDKTLEIVVVDNASIDGSVEVISNFKFQISNFKLIINKENYGFARGCNIGANAASGNYLLFLNSDTEVLDNGFFKMAEFLKIHKDIGILGGKLLNIDGSPQPSGGNFFDIPNLFLTLIGGERLGLTKKIPKKIEKTDWVSGAFMMIRGDLFRKVLGFDEHFFMYIEDQELCFRVRKIGFLTYFFPKVILIHKSLGSSNRTFAIMNIYKGILYFYSKHKSRLEYFIAFILLWGKAIVLIFIGIITLNTSLYKRYIRAIKNTL